ncbi:Glucuronoyl esterase catalytic domain from Hypocrea Jecorina [Mycena floridula]|nr:Glucuronoyl esterase catalytic domain from Hypocrea Jecorina [Mycena floridula]
MYATVLSGSFPVTDVGPSATACAPLPDTINLVPYAELNDPFTFLNGTPVVTKADFTCRQQEINQLFQRYELGTFPGPPDTLNASLSGSTLTINVSNAGKSISFTVSISKPSGTGPFPAIIGIGGISIPTPAGVAVINFNNNDMAAQNDQSSRGVGKFYNLFGSNHSAGALTAWAWGVSRVIDALELTPAANIDLTKLAVSGCSRNGKGALVAGVFEPRIALTIPQESGSGGSGSWRISDSMGNITQTAHEIVQENVWLSPVFNQYVDEVTILPFDHHMLSMIIAPRALLVIDNTDIIWLGPESVWGAQTTARLAWQALGVPDNMGVSVVGNHSHCAFPATEQPELTAFVNKFLKGQSTNTTVVRTSDPNNNNFTASDWVSWTTPTLI